MKNNWKKAKKIFSDALKLAPAERSAFLNEVCAGDKELRREVESLLASYNDAESFMETPAVSVNLIEVETKKLEAGKCFGHYEIVKQIGAGGMGEIYLANDKKLDRQVAVKILNEKFAKHESNLNRFIQEAKAASALNHPNILVIHEIGETDEIHYIVSEFIEGETLREHFRKSPANLGEILDISTQIANALVAAHTAHIVHRDIKPENIIVRPDGFVKVLDFGLAKLVEKKNKSLIGLEEETIKQNQTAKGLILGTINYMSPEQAKGEKVDERTDIFSFGVLIYEMIAGRTPFVGDSMSETFANLIHKEPQLLSRYSEGVPDELQKITSKMLRKNKDERYQTIKGLLADLKELRENLTFEEKLKHLQPPNENTTKILRANTQNSNILPDETQSNSSKEIKRRKPFAVIVLIALVIGAVGFGYWFFIYRVPNTNKVESVIVDAPKSTSKIYWKMTEPEQITFIRERAQHIQKLIGDEPTEFDEEALQAIKVEIDDYVEEKDSLSQKPFEEGLRVIYGRASQYAPVIIRAYEARQVPPSLGLYQAMVESEYHDCPTNPHPKGPVGLFQFSRKTAAIYDLMPKDYCNVEKQSDAAARYMSDLISDFGEQKSSWTLALLSFNQGGELTREHLRQLRGRGITERSFWEIFHYREDLQIPLSEVSVQYVPHFFAAAIIGESPEIFDLSTPPLSTLREKDK